LLGNSSKFISNPDRFNKRVSTESSPKGSTQNKSFFENNHNYGIKQLRLTLNPGQSGNARPLSEQDSGRIISPKKPQLYVLPMKNPENNQVSLPKITLDSKDAYSPLNQNIGHPMRNNSIDLTPPSDKRIRRFSEQLLTVKPRFNPSITNYESLGMMRAKPSRLGSLDLNFHIPSSPENLKGDPATKSQSLFNQELNQQQPSSPKKEAIEIQIGNKKIELERPLNPINEVGNTPGAINTHAKERNESKINIREIPREKPSGYNLKSFKRICQQNKRVKLADANQSSMQGSSSMAGKQGSSFADNLGPFGKNDYYIPVHVRQSRSEASQLMLERVAAIRAEASQMSRSLQKESVKVKFEHVKTQVDPRLLKARAASVRLVADVVNENKRLERMIMPTLTPLKHEPGQKVTYLPTPKSGGIEDAHFD
jgi:hypothetical protein